jgi:integrase/recombinase XerC
VKPWQYSLAKWKFPEAIVTGIPQDGQAPPDLRREWAAAYATHLESQRRLSQLTTKNYLRDVHELFALCPQIPLQELAAKQLRHFMATLHSRGLSGRTLARMLSAWRSFFSWLCQYQGFALNPCSGLKAPRQPHLLPQALSPDVTGHLMEVKGEDDLALRDRAMLELFYSSGLRLSELAQLNREDLQENMHTVRVTGKGAKTRIVPVGTKAREALVRYLEKHPPNTPALFLSRLGKRLSVRAIEERVRMRAQQAGLSEPVHPHMLRHSFASHVLQSSGDLRAVQEMLGHASIASTQVYTHLDFQHLAKTYDQAHPRARKKDTA